MGLYWIISRVAVSFDSLWSDINEMIKIEHMETFTGDFWNECFLAYDLHSIFLPSLIFKSTLAYLIPSKYCIPGEAEFAFIVIKA